MTLIPANGISTRRSAAWLKQRNLNIINDLLEMGFIHPKNDREILLHPVVREVAVEELKSSVCNSAILLDEKKAISALYLIKQRELSRRVAKLTEDIEELHSEKAFLTGHFEKNDDEGMKDMRKWVTSMEKSLQQLEKIQAKYKAELDAALAQFREQACKGEDMDKVKLYRQRQSLRDSFTQEARENFNRLTKNTAMYSL